MHMKQIELDFVFWMILCFKLLCLKNTDAIKLFLSDYELLLPDTTGLLDLSFLISSIFWCFLIGMGRLKKDHFNWMNFFLNKGKWEVSIKKKWDGHSVHTRLSHTRSVTLEYYSSSPNMCPDMNRKIRKYLAAIMVCVRLSSIYFSP